MHPLGNPGVCVGGRHGQADRAQGAQVGQVVAHEGDLVQADAVGVAQRAHAGQLVADRDLGVDAQVRAPLLCRQAVARGDQHRVDAVLLQQFQAKSVLHVIRLALVALTVVVEPTVGERAVHVEAGQPDAAGDGMQVGRETGQRGIGHRRGRSG
ncbi:hypothetical protein D3C72_1956630 [compost metagenome]